MDGKAEERTETQRGYVAPTRPREELYDVIADPWNENNLVQSTDHQDVLRRMRGALTQWIVEMRDVSFLPEEEVWRRIDKQDGQTPYELRKSPAEYPLARLLDAASQVGAGPESLESLVKGLSDDEPGVRYWAAMAIGALGPQAASAEKPLVAALKDPSVAVRIEAAQAMARMGQIDLALPLLVRELESTNVDAVLHAARAIELLGPQARKAASAMQQAREKAQGGGTIEMFIRFSADAFLNQVRG